MSPTTYYFEEKDDLLHIQVKASGRADLVEGLTGRQHSSMVANYDFDLCTLHRASTPAGNIRPNLFPELGGRLPPSLRFPGSRPTRWRGRGP